MERSPRVVRWLECGLLFVCLSYLCLHVMPRAWRGLITDFPNYYMAARLAREHCNTARMYEWRWLQREKDIHAAGVRVIGLSPITPFSTLSMWPVARFSALTAKRIWIVLNLGLLLPIGWLLHGMTRLDFRRIALIFVLSIPLQRNLEFGQFYILLMLLITAACGAYLYKYRACAGALIAIAAACKIFPTIFVVLFIRRRDWRALASFAVTGAAAIGLSIAVFGWSVHRTYALQILPWALHGEAMPPYVPSASISGILHRLFLPEPQWNPHPWHASPLLYALLLALLQVLILAPTVLLIRRQESSPTRTLLEWSALISASLTVSTDPASYNFVLMAFPICVLAAILLRRKRYVWTIALLIAYLGIGFPFPAPSSNTPTAILFSTPRLLLMAAVLLGINWLLWSDPKDATSTPYNTRYLWISAFAIAFALTVYGTLSREQSVRSEYRYRLSLPAQGYLNATPQFSAGKLLFIVFTLNGYHLSQFGNSLSKDDLSFASGNGHTWIEQGASPYSQVVDGQSPMRVVLNNARDLMLAADGQSLAFIRDDHGQGRLMLRTGLISGAQQELDLTPASLNVYEGSFLSRNDYAFAATEGPGFPHIFLTNAMHANAQLPLGEARYPALSHDGQWLAYSRLSHGVWNLWIRNERTGLSRRIAKVPCNQIQPSWGDDSKTLFYSTDCGRSLWFTAIARRRVIP